MTPAATPTDAATSRPLALWAGVALVGLQSVGIGAYAISELVYGIAKLSGMAVGVSVFGGAYAAGLGYGAYVLFQRRSPARAPLVLAQLLHLGIAWNMRDAPLTAYAIALAALSVVTLVAVLAPSTTRVLVAAEEPGADGASDD